LRDSFHFLFVSRPFVLIAAALMSGIVFARWFNPLFPAYLIALTAILPLFLWKRVRWTGAALFCFVLGACLYAERYRISSSNDSRSLFSGEPELVTIRGRLVDTPSVREVQAGRGEFAYSYGLIDLTEARKDKGKWEPAKGRVATRMRGELTSDFFQGRSVEATGVIARPSGAAAPGLFDYRAYLHHTRVFFQLKCDSTNDWQLLSFESMPLTERFRRWAAAQLQRGIPAEDEATEIIAAMTLGMRNSLSGEMADVFMRTGTLHVIAISGLHVACIAYFFSMLVRLAGLPRSLEAVLIIAVVWFYTAATGLQSSACRAAVMATVLMFRWIFNRPPELLNSVAASAVLILFVQPEQLFQTSFQLSFSVVAVIALAATFAGTRFPDWSVSARHWILRIDPLLPYDLVPRWKKLAKWVLGFAFANFFVSFASWIGSMPLTAYYFNTVTPISLFANLLAVPLSSLSLGATVVSILLPWLAPVSNYIAWLAMKWTIAVVEFCGSFSFGYFYVPRPHAFFLFAYAIAIALLFIPFFRTGLRKFASAALVTTLSLVWLGSVYAAKPLAQITVLSCAGTPVFVEEPWWNELLIDCSSSRDAEFTLKRFLRARGRGSLDALLVTHGDAQVVGGFETIWEEFRPTKVYTSSVRMRSPGYRRLIQFLGLNPADWQKIAVGDSVAGWTVLHPASTERGFPRADDNAVVLRRKIASWTFLHLSDLGEAGQIGLSESNLDLKADIVFSGLPEQTEALQPELLKQIQPKVIILGTSAYPHTSRGSAEFRRRLESTGAKILYVDEEGAVTVTISPKQCRITTMAGTYHSLAPSHSVRTTREAD
jgi:competence protein ComEC